MYNASAESVLGIASFQTSYITPAIIKLKDKLFPPSQKTLDKRLAGEMSVYLFGLTGAMKTIKDALAKGANPNTTSERLDSEWRTIGTEPLLVKAVRFNSGQLVTALVEAGADVNATDSSGKTALDHAKERWGSKTIAGYLEAQGAVPSVSLPADRYDAGTMEKNGFRDFKRPAAQFNGGHKSTVAPFTTPTNAGPKPGPCL